MTAAETAAACLYLEIDGMHCEACVRRVTQALTRSGAGRLDKVAIGGAHIAAPYESVPLLLAALKTAGFTARLS